MNLGTRTQSVKTVSAKAGDKGGIKLCNLVGTHPHPVWFISVELTRIFSGVLVNARKSSFLHVSSAEASPTLLIRCPGWNRGLSLACYVTNPRSWTVRSLG